jgi:hypothetical protein
MRLSAQRQAGGAQGARHHLFPHARPSRGDFLFSIMSQRERC